MNILVQDDAHHFHYFRPYSKLTLTNIDAHLSYYYTVLFHFLLQKNMKGFQLIKPELRKIG